MRYFVGVVAAVGVGLALLGSSDAGDKAKEVTLKGKVTCAKCDLGKTTECATVIVVKNKDMKETIIYFDEASHKKHHGEVCMESKNGTVVGVVTTKGDKKSIAVKKVTYK